MELKNKNQKGIKGIGRKISIRRISMKKVFLTTVTVAVAFIAFILNCGVCVAQSQSELVTKFRRALQPVETKGIGGVQERHLILQLHFKLNSYELTPDAITQLNALGKAISEDAELKDYIYRIEGHTCSLGSSQYNLWLSKKRAEAVVEYLTKYFPLKKSQFIVVGFGEEKPIAPNTTEEGREKNRRVEIVNTIKKITQEESSDTENAESEFKPVKEIKVEYLKDGKEIATLTQGTVLTSNDSYAIQFTLTEKVYVYILQDSGEKIEMLFPNEKFSRHTNPPNPWELIRVPDFGRWISLDNNPGKETIVLVASKEPIDDPVSLYQKDTNQVQSKGFQMEEIQNKPDSQDTPDISSDTPETEKTPENYFIWKISFIHK